jgi:superfamily I DNA/RNA helicase
VDLRDESDSLPVDSIVIGTTHLAKDLEYRAVYIGQLPYLFKPDEAIPFAQYASFQAKETRLLYGGLARAPDRVCPTYQRLLLKGFTGFG